jgi:hypothetical protein
MQETNKKGKCLYCWSAKFEVLIGNFWVIIKCGLVKHINVLVKCTATTFRVKIKPGKKQTKKVNAYCWLLAWLTQ